MNEQLGAVSVAAKRRHCFDTTRPMFSANPPLYLKSNIPFGNRVVGGPDLFVVIGEWRFTTELTVSSNEQTCCVMCEISKVLPLLHKPTINFAETHYGLQSRRIQ